MGGCASIESFFGRRETKRLLRMHDVPCCDVQRKTMSHKLTLNMVSVTPDCLIRKGLSIHSLTAYVLAARSLAGIVDTIAAKSPDEWMTR